MTTTITKLTHFLAHPGRGKNLLFVRLETSDGRHGWGECYTQADRDTQVVAHLDQLERYVVGWDASQIKQFTDAAYNDFSARRGAMDYYSAISGIEQAMWDLTGKRAGMPVHELLGGRCRDRVRVYANGWARSSSHEELAASARETVARGFSALKFDPVPGPWRTLISREQEAEAVERVRLVREAVGPDVEILVEMHRRLAPMQAVRIAKAIEEFRPFWFEEPVLAENLTALAEVRRAISIPVVTGEELYTKWEFREVFEQRAADILNPDVCNVGGILELKEIAAMAEPHLVAMSPHNYNSTTVGLAATVQASATMPNFLITEYFVNLEEFGRAVAVEPLLQEDGYVTVPTAPGLGIDLDPDALARFPYQQFPPRTIARLEGSSTRS
ncbi:MAG: mandelate racemase/muconate lactonizing enzyme family protein [Chloroflexi bacterium]|nr:mandelate racemase/muconate lactonizing enzyme family protein [Chloroflexota bacterium]MDA1145974.1 mandelate racemase/muconate lactonizing enzyme family protein [Chloroflexota bacterium]